RPLGPLAPRRNRPLGEGRRNPLMPRALDVLIAALALAILSPVLLVAAIAIKLTSPGPVVYRQRRVGLGGREFEMWKLRTMVQGSDPVGVGRVVYRDDPRVTRPGRLLRRTSLDEQSPGRRLHAPPETPPRGPAGDHRLGPGSGPRRHPLGGADRARCLVR